VGGVVLLGQVRLTLADLGGGHELMAVELREARADAEMRLGVAMSLRRRESCGDRSFATTLPASCLTALPRPPIPTLFSLYQHHEEQG
jgi:hypothetical protein